MIETTAIDLTRMLEITAYNLYLATLVGHPAPWVEALGKRMKAPVVGDLVLETSTVYRERESGTGFGRLLSIAQEPMHTREAWDSDEPIPDERVYYIKTLDGREYRWVNASFIAVPESIQGSGRVDFRQPSVDPSRGDAGGTGE